MADDNQNCSSKLKNMHEEVAYQKIEEKSHEFLRKLYPFIRDYQGQLPNLKDIFQPGAIDWLLAESVKSADSEIEPKPLVDFLIRTGYKDEPKVDKDGKPLLHRTTALTLAARHWLVPYWSIVIPGLFKIYDRFDVNYTDEAGYTHFHTACKYGYEGVVEKFLELGQDPNCIVTETGDSPLHLALTWGSNNLIECLLRNGANPNLANAKGTTLMHIICAEGGDDAAVKKIVEISNELNQPFQVDAQDKLGNTPLHLTVFWCDKNSIKFLLRNCADPNLANEEGSTFLHVVSQSRHDDYDVLNVFFEITDDVRQSVQIDARDKLGRTPLQLAVANLNPNVIDILLDRGADLSSFVFPTASYFGTSFDQIDDVDNCYDNLKLRLTYGAVSVVERIKNRGYDFDRSDVRTIVKFFSKYELFEKSVDLGKCWRDAEDFAIQAKKIMIRDKDPTLSLYDVVRLRPEQAEKLLTFTDHCKFWLLINWWDFPKWFREACTGPLCEIMLRRLSRRWALDPILELTHYRLPILCCETIIKNLMNEDLWNICLAATSQN
ncbi:tankyrase-like [Trichogramma pretiosum]|uniref:tankyrase-like n=1 Tax=Trichogramma pretiosum TaxID=7493 RepID=UPI000C71C68A|nr:tankyrase-like [Trichogramma pretiosum]